MRRIYKGLNKNGEGYSDYVAARAIQAADKQPEKVSQYIRCIKDLADLFDFEIAGYVSVRDKKTGGYGRWEKQQDRRRMSRKRSF